MKKSSLLITVTAILIIVIILFSIFKLDNKTAAIKPIEVRDKLDNSYAKTSVKTKDKIALISIKTIIHDGMVDAVTAKIRAAREDENIKAIILEVESPGGTVHASNIIWNEMVKVRTSSKPVVASFNGIAASGGYYIAAPADKIVATPGALTGSIGVIIEGVDYSELMRKIGVKKTVFKSGRYKDILSPYRSMSEQEGRIMQDMVMKHKDRFIKIVSDGRKMDEGKVRRIADDALVYLAEDALELGLIDQIGYLEDAFEAAKKLAKLETASLVRYETEKDLINDFYEKFDRLEKTVLDILGMRNQFQFYFL